MTAYNHNFMDSEGKIDFAAWDASLSQEAKNFRDSNFMDAQVGMAFLTPQMYRIEAEVYQTRYPSFDYSALAYVNTEGGLWSVGSVFYSGDIAGKAEFFNAGGFDMPFASVANTQFVQENRLAAIGYEWNISELNRASMVGRNLSSDKAMAASKVAEAFCYNIFISGNSEKNMDGLIGYTGVSAAAATTGTWGAATGDEVVGDMFEVMDDVPTNTGEVHQANTLLLPSTAFREASNKRMGDTNETALSYFRRTYRESRRVEVTVKDVRDLQTAGATDTRRMVAYDNSREVVQFHLPGPHQFLPAYQKSSTVYEVGGLLNIGGTEIRLPKAVSYRDGI